MLDDDAQRRKQIVRQSRLDYLCPPQCLVGRLMGKDGHQKYRITK
jgi:hypothetical protein